MPPVWLKKETFNYVFRLTQFQKIDKRLRDSGLKVKISKFTEEEVKYIDIFLNFLSPNTVV